MNSRRIEQLDDGTARYIDERERPPVTCVFQRGAGDAEFTDLAPLTFWLLQRATWGTTLNMSAAEGYRKAHRYARYARRQYHEWLNQD